MKEMDGLLKIFEEVLKEHACAEVDLCSDQPGYEEFSKACDAEYENRNYSKAKEFYEKACSKGHPMALCNYALWYLEGQRPGVSKDLKKAFGMFQQSAESGSIGMAQYNLAGFYYTGKDGVVAKDLGKAFHLAREAIKDSRVEAMRQGEPYFLLGSMYSMGHGCIRNAAKGLRYFEKAKEFGHTGADQQFMKMVNVLAQIDPMQSQNETDIRWDRMTNYLDHHPDEKPKTMGGHERILNRFGFKVTHKLTSSEKRLKGEIDKFMEITGGEMSLMPTYEMEDAPKAPKKCEYCKKEGASKRCTKCGELYCNRACQKADWKDHKRVCQAIQDEQSL